MRRHLTSVITLVVLLVAALAACSDDSSSSNESLDDTASGESAPDESVDDAAFDAVPVIEAVPPTDGDPTQATWFLRADPIGDGDQLRVVFLANVPCETLDRVDVVETEDAVALTVWTWLAPVIDCAYSPTWVRTTVQLDAPLGDREVRDGSPAEPMVLSGHRIPEADDELFNVRTMPIEHTLLTPDGNAVWATWSGGACDVLEGADVERDGDTVSVTVRTGVETPTGPCTANIVFWWTLVELDEPATDVTVG